MIESNEVKDKNISKDENKKYLTLLGVILLFGTFMRLFKLAQSPIWLDEAHTIWVAGKSLPDLIQYINIYEVHPHFYYVFIHLWMKFAGSGIFLLRLPSALMGVASIYLVFLLAREISGTKIALVAALFMSFSNFEILYAQEIRMYCVLLLSTTLICYNFIRAMKTGKWHYWVFFVLSSLLGIYNDYRTALLVAICNLFFLIFYKSFKDQLKKILAADILIGILSVPLIPIFLHQTGPAGGGTSINIFYSDVSFILVMKTIFSLFGGFVLPVSNLFVVIFALILLSIIVVGVTYHYRESGKFALLLPLIFVLSLTAVILYSIFRTKIYSINNMMFLSPIFLVLLSQSIFELKKKFAPLFFIIIIVFFGINSICNNLWFNNPRYNKQDFRTVVNYIIPRIKPDDKIALVPEYQKFAFNYYYKGNSTILYLTPRTLMDPEVQQTLQEPGRIWWIFASDGYMDPTRKVRRWVDSNYRILEAVEVESMNYHPVVSGNIQVYLGERKLEGGSQKLDGESRK